VAAAGFSAGGGVVALMACDLAGRVASVALLSGALYTEPGECRPARAVPVLAVHGTEVVHYRINGGGHEAPRSIAGRSIARVLWEFFAAHPMPG
jgi:poly(3-hydroxybutyrate) depolymerase